MNPKLKAPINITENKHTLVFEFANEDNKLNFLHEYAKSLHCDIRDPKKIISSIKKKLDHINFPPDENFSEHEAREALFQGKSANEPRVCPLKAKDTKNNCYGVHKNFNKLVTHINRDHACQADTVTNAIAYLQSLPNSQRFFPICVFPNADRGYLHRLACCFCEFIEKYGSPSKYSNESLSQSINEILRNKRGGVAPNGLLNGKYSCFFNLDKPDFFKGCELPMYATGRMEDAQLLKISRLLNLNPETLGEKISYTKDDLADCINQRLMEIRQNAYSDDFFDDIMDEEEDEYDFEQYY